MTIFFDFKVVKDDVENNSAALFYFTKERAKQVKGHVSIICCDENGSDKKKKISFSKEEKKAWCGENLELTGVEIKKIKHPNMKADFANPHTFLIDKEEERVNKFFYNCGIGILHTTFENTQNALTQIFDALEKYPVTDKENEGEQIQQARLRHALDNYRSLQKKDSETLLYEKIRSFAKLFKYDDISLDEAKLLWKQKFPKNKNKEFKNMLKDISDIFATCEINAMQKKNLSQEILEEFCKYAMKNKKDWILNVAPEDSIFYATTENYLKLLNKSNAKILQMSDFLEDDKTLGKLYDYKKIKLAFSCLYISQYYAGYYLRAQVKGWYFEKVLKDDSYSLKDPAFRECDIMPLSIFCFMMWNYPAVELSRKEILNLIDKPHAHHAHKYNQPTKHFEKLDDIKIYDYDYDDTDPDIFFEKARKYGIKTNVFEKRKNRREFTTLAMNLYIEKLYDEIDKLREAEF